MNTMETVLVIDDDVDFCSLVSLLAEREGFTTGCAYSLATSQYMIETLNPDLVMLDNNLPDGTGISFYLNNRNLFVNRHVYMVTADPSEDLKRIAMESGVEIFFTKPLMLAEFKKIFHHSLPI